VHYNSGSFIFFQPMHTTVARFSIMYLNTKFAHACDLTGPSSESTIIVVVCNNYLTISLRIAYVEELLWFWDASGSSCMLSNGVYLFTATRMGWDCCDFSTLLFSHLLDFVFLLLSLVSTNPSVEAESSPRAFFVDTSSSTPLSK